jgi:hypothetical protein
MAEKQGMPKINIEKFLEIFCQKDTKNEPATSSSEYSGGEAMGLAVSQLLLFSPEVLRVSDST